MTEIYAKGIAELFLIRCNPYHWDGSGEVPDDVKFDVYKRKIDETYDGSDARNQLSGSPWLSLLCGVRTSVRRRILDGTRHWLLRQDCDLQ